MTDLDQGFKDEAAYLADHVDASAANVQHVQAVHQGRYLLSGEPAGPAGTSDKVEISYEHGGRFWRLTLEEVPF